MDPIQEKAKAISQDLRPPRWRVWRYREWRRTQQPEHVIEAIRRNLVGEVEPVRRYGISLK